MADTVVQEEGPNQKAIDKGIRRLLRQTNRLDRQIRKRNLVRRIGFMNVDDEHDDYEVEYLHEGGPSPFDPRVELAAGPQRVKASQLADIASKLADSEEEQDLLVLADLDAKFGTDIEAYRIKGRHLKAAADERDRITAAELGLQQHGLQQAAEVEALDALYNKARAAGLKEIDAAHSLDKEIGRKRLTNLRQRIREAAPLKADIRRANKLRWFAGKEDRLAARAAVAGLFGAEYAAARGAPVEVRAPAGDVGEIERQIIAANTGEGGALESHAEALNELSAMDPTARAAKLAALRGGNDSQQAAAAAYERVSTAAQQKAEASRGAPQAYAGAMETMTTEALADISRQRFLAAIGGEDALAAVKREAELRAELQRARLEQQTNRKKRTRDYDKIKPKKGAEERQIGNEMWRDVAAATQDLLFGGKVETLTEGEALKVRTAVAVQIAPNRNPAEPTTRGKALALAAKRAAMLTPT